MRMARGGVALIVRGGMMRHFCYQPGWIVFVTWMQVGTSTEVVCGCSDGTSSSLAAGQNRLEQ